MPAVREYASENLPLTVAIARYFEVALYLLAFTGFGTLASTGGLDVPTILLVCTALLFRGYLLITQKDLHLSDRWTTVLTVAYIGFYLVDYFFSPGVLKRDRTPGAVRDGDAAIFGPARPRPVLYRCHCLPDGSGCGRPYRRQHFPICFRRIHVGGRDYVHPDGDEARRPAKSIDSGEETSDARAYRHMALSLAGASPVIVFFILLGAAAIFFLLPRFSAGYLSAYAPGNELTTGFSDHVQLGSIGEIQQSSSVVMHIQIDGDRAGAYDLEVARRQLSATSTGEHGRTRTFATPFPACRMESFS